jgi:hypothetical protein
MVCGELAKKQAAKTPHADEVPGGNRIICEIRDDGQGPLTGHFASLWKNGGTHFAGWRGLKTPKSVNCGEILPNSYGLEQVTNCGLQVIVLLGADKAQSSEEHPSAGRQPLKVLSFVPMILCTASGCGHEDWYSNLVIVEAPTFASSTLTQTNPEGPGEVWIHDAMLGLSFRVETGSNHGEPIKSNP